MLWLLELCYIRLEWLSYGCSWVRVKLRLSKGDVMLRSRNPGKGQDIVRLLFIFMHYSSSIHHTHCLPGRGSLTFACATAFPCPSFSAAAFSNSFSFPSISFSFFALALPSSFLSFSVWAFSALWAFSFAALALAFRTFAASLSSRWKGCGSGVLEGYWRDVLELGLFFCSFGLGFPNLHMNIIIIIIITFALEGRV